MIPPAQLPIDPSRRAVATRAWLLLVLAALASPARADEGTPAANGCTALAFQGKASFKDLGPLGEQEFTFDLTVLNRTDAPIEILHANLLLGTEGGWLLPLDPESVDGSFFRGKISVPVLAPQTVAGQTYRSQTPATHAMFFASAQDGHCAMAIPILREGFQPPPAVAPAFPFDVGIVAPLHALPFADGSHAVMLVGQHQVLDGSQPADLQTSVGVSSDAGMAEPLSWKGADAEGDLEALWPFVRRIPLHAGFAGGMLSVQSSATVGGQVRTFSRTWPVQRVEPRVLRSPVQGKWLLSNGPGQSVFHDHYAQPHLRYAYDMLVLNRLGRTHEGDPHVNESYFAFNRDVLAAADGEVVAFCHAENDNPGYSGSSKQCHVNYVVLKHEGGFFTAYLHLMKRSLHQGLVVGSRVKAGVQIAKVGNSGESSEPHLKFLAFTIDQTGRLAPLPVTFSNGHLDAEGTQPFRGIPAGGREYHFLGP